MGMKKMALAAALGLSMASAPVMAQTTQSSGPAAIERAGASMDESSEIRGGRFPFLIVFVIIAIGLGIYFAVSGSDDGPTSA